MLYAHNKVTRASKILMEKVCTNAWHQFESTTESDAATITRTLYTHIHIHVNNFIFAT